MGVAPRQFKWEESKGNDGHFELKSFPVVNATTDPNRTVPIVPGRFVVQCTAGSNSTVDGAAAANSTTAGRLFVGLCVEVRDTMGRALDRQYLGATDAGIAVVIPCQNSVFSGVEDGDGGVLTSYTTGMAGLALGTVAPGAYTSDSQTNFPAQWPNDKVDSSTYHASTARAFKLLGLVPTLENSLPSVVNKCVRFEISPTFLASV